MHNIFKYFKISYIALFLIIIWDPLRVYVFPEKGSGYIILVFVTVSLTKEIFSKSFWQHLFKTPYLLWSLWIIYALVNTFYINSYMAELTPNTFKFSVFLPLFVLLVIANERYDILELTNLFIGAFFTRICLSLIFDDFNIQHDVARFGEYFNANEIAIGALFLIVLIGFNKIMSQKISIINYIQILLALYTMALTASRTALISLAILTLGYVYINKTENITKRYAKYIAALAILIAAAIYILNNTGVGERMISAYYDTIYAARPEYMFDNRLGQYLLGIDLFKMQPINGIGLKNFMYVGNYPAVAHSEYIVQFAECGLIGVSLWLLFYGVLIRNLFNVRKVSIYHQKLANIPFFYLGYVFLMTGTWVYNMAIYWVMLGLLIKFTEESRNFLNGEVSEYQFDKSRNI